MKEYKILTINPGSTSTKLAVFKGEECIYKDSINHSREELSAFTTNVHDQKDFRTNVILDSLQNSGIDLADMDAIVGRCGFLPPPLISGTYIVDDHVCNTLEFRAVCQHAANLGPVLAKNIGDKYGLPAYFVDSEAIIEVEPLSRISGHKGIDRRAYFHCLNAKAVARVVAEDMGKTYQDANFVIAHMGGGISASAHKNGRAIDCTCGLLGEGSFSPERAGTLGIQEVITMTLEETAAGATREDMERVLNGKSGIYSYLGTADAREVEKMIESGNSEAKLIYEAMAYTISKDIAAMSSVLKGSVDAIILTGGLAHSKMLTGWIMERVSFITKVIIVPGEIESEAMVRGVTRVFNGIEELLVYEG